MTTFWTAEHASDLSDYTSITGVASFTGGCGHAG